MIKFNTYLAERLILILLAMLSVFHLLVIVGLVPYDIVWGGRLESFKTAQSIEVFSLALSIFMFSIVAIHAGYLKPLLSKKVTLVFIRIFLGFFLIGTIGNLFSKNPIEHLLFAPITFVLALCCLRISIAKK